MRRSPLIDLGADRTRMKDRRDVERQEKTVDEILERIFSNDPERRFELQVLADEVGMGKTFVALGVAFSMLEAKRERTGEQPGTNRKILVLVPQNDALFKKWRREVGEFVKRCFAEKDHHEATKRLRGETASRPDEIAAALADKYGPQVVIAKTSALGAKVQHLDLKARVVMSAIFREWGNAFRIDARERVLKGAQEWGWPRQPNELCTFTEPERERLRIDTEELTAAVRELMRKHDDELGFEGLLERCRDVSTPHRRNRAEGFRHIRIQLASIYKAAAFSTLKSRLPLVIVDEAHNWKNGPTGGTNNYKDFVEHIAHRTRRLLLLTATPFQLRPDEMVEILKLSDRMGIHEERRARLRVKRERDIRAVLEMSSQASVSFSKNWAALATTTAPDALLDVWRSSAMVQAREELSEIADRSGALRTGEIDLAVDRGIRGVDPSQRRFFMEALKLFAYNRDLSQELGELVVRHRRHVDHRLTRVGAEFRAPTETVATRPDAHALHAAAGIDVEGDAELPHYLLMRATSELTGGKGKSALGSNLTGCYSTMFKSAETKSFSRLDPGGRAATYIDTLRTLVGHPEADASHPKMATVIEDVLARWERGEKTLVFTFRTNTAERLRDLLEAGLRERLDARKKTSFGGHGGVESLRKRLTGRDRDLIPLVLDRVLWSALWAPPGGGIPPFGPDHLQPQREDYSELARLGLVFGVDLTARLVDRVFLQRAVECAVARRLRSDVPRGSQFRKHVIEHVGDESWVARAYGGIALDEDEAESGQAMIDERGVHTAYERGLDPSKADVEALARQLLERDAAARRSSVIRLAFDGPSLWLGREAAEQLWPRFHLEANVEADTSDQRFFHVHLGALTWGSDGPDWRTRALTMQAVRRAALRDSLLVRLLPTAAQLEEDAWGGLLVDGFLRGQGDGNESMLRRLGVFVEDMASAGGSIDNLEDARGALYDATKLRGQSGVTLVSGDTKGEQRTRIFSGFNTPLLPEILICTSVGQEGIDLHRHCRNVVHYDLAWNPATLEQRTGRTDRIGSLALRERQLRKRKGGQLTFLEIGVPYLAGTYDERMFEELRLRAQTFEVLTGGELAADHVDGLKDDSAHDDEGKSDGPSLVTLPKAMVDEMRVNLAVYEAGVETIPPAGA